jgi:hypothetical protein
MSDSKPYPQLIAFILLVSFLIGTIFSIDERYANKSEVDRQLEIQQAQYQQLQNNFLLLLESVSPEVKETILRRNEIIKKLESK